jgi:hypothetical protein
VYRNAATGIALSLVLLVACQASRKPPVSIPSWDALASMETPKVFSIAQPWTFTETDDDGHVVRSFTIVFTADPAPTCIDGDWRSARVHPSPSATIGDTAAVSFREGAPQPAYLLEGSALWINLVSGICDWSDDFVGQLTADGFIGYSREEGLFHYRVKWKVYGTPVHGSEKPDP